MTRERKGKEWIGDLPILHKDQPVSPTLWATLFPQPRPLEVDLGCGKGRFLMAHAGAHPDRDFLGVDLQLRRLGKLNQRALDRGLGNIRLICGEIQQTLEKVIPDLSIDACYVFFPDPWPKRKHHPRRLVNAAFLNAIHRILKPGGLLHLATDHADYFAAMLKVVTPDPRFEPAPLFLPTPEERTDFELIFAGQSLSVNRHSLRKRP